MVVRLWPFTSFWGPVFSGKSRCANLRKEGGCQGSCSIFCGGTWGRQQDPAVSGIRQWGELWWGRTVADRRAAQAQVSPWKHAQEPGSNSVLSPCVLKLASCRASKGSLGNCHSSSSFSPSIKHSYQNHKWMLVFCGMSLYWNTWHLVPLFMESCLFKGTLYFAWESLAGFSKPFLRNSPRKYNAQAKAQAQAARRQHHSPTGEVLLINIVYDSCHSQHSLLTCGLDLVTG